MMVLSKGLLCKRLELKVLELRVGVGSDRGLGPLWLVETSLWMVMTRYSRKLIRRLESWGIGEVEDEIELKEQGLWRLT